MALYRNEDETGAGSKIGELLQVWVSPQHQGHGVATEILETVCGWAKENGFTTIIAGIFPGNSRALAFYEKHGFRQTSKGAVDGSDGIVIVKEIRHP